MYIYEYTCISNNIKVSLSTISWYFAFTSPANIFLILSKTDFTGKVWHFPRLGFDQMGSQRLFSEFKLCARSAYGVNIEFCLLWFMFEIRYFFLKAVSCCLTIIEINETAFSRIKLAVAKSHLRANSEFLHFRTNVAILILFSQSGAFCARKSTTPYVPPPTAGRLF